MTRVYNEYKKLVGEELWFESGNRKDIMIHLLDNAKNRIFIFD